MKIRSVCNICLDNWEQNNVAPDEIERRLSISWRIITSFDAIQEWKCQAGHRNFTWLSTPFYDLLYSKALSDLARLDTRSAGINFFTAWENFLAHTVNLLLKKVGVADDLPHSLTLSERRLGLYVGAYAAAAGEFPKLPKDDTTRMLRNKIVHDNMIPSEDDIIAAAEDIRSCIVHAMQKLTPLHQNYNEGPSIIKRQQDAITKAQIISHPIQFEFLQSQIPHDIADKIRLIREESAENTANAHPSL